MIILNENDFGTAVRAFEKKNGHKKKAPPSLRGKYELSQRSDELITCVASYGPMSSKEIALMLGYKIKDVQNSLYQARASGVVHTAFFGNVAKWVSGPKPRGIHA